MGGFEHGRLAAITGLVALGLGVLPGTVAAADGPKSRFLKESLASQLVQQMAQRRIFEADDRTDAVCKEKELLQAAVVQQPVSTSSGSIEVVKWQEDWTLRRCDQTVAYRVFYNEIGKGGMTVSVASHDGLRNPAPSVVAVAKANPELLALQQPPLRGTHVASVQKALILAGYKLKADGVYGPGTQKAVMKFQEAKGMRPSGSVDEKTREALGL